MFVDPKVILVSNVCRQVCAIDCAVAILGRDNQCELPVDLWEIRGRVDVL
jgi:hypothetical protein